MSAPVRNPAYFFSRAFERELMVGSDAAARRHLAAGRPTFYMSPQHPGQIIRKNPDGHEEFVDVLLDGRVLVIRSL